MALHLRYTTCLALLSILAGCGGGGDDDDDEPAAPAGPGWSTPPPAPSLPVAGASMEGVFRDALVEGLDYSDGGAFQNTTGASGKFQYAEGNTVTFWIGGLVLGSYAGQPFMTPRHLVGTPTNLTQSVNNRLRLLQMLDVDANPNNGILIHNATRAAAQNWITPEFNLADSAFDTAIASIRQDAISADQGTHPIPTAANAVAHFSSAFWCTFNGLYRGTYSGGDSGVWAMVVYGQSAQMFGGGYSSIDKEGFELQKTAASAVQMFPSFTAGQTGGGVSFTGVFRTPNLLAGTWANTPDSGTFSGGRSGGSDTAIYRINGYVFPLGTALLISLEVDAANQVTGQIIDRDYLRTAEPVSLTGTLSGTTLTATGTGNAYTINGTFNTANAASLQLTGALRDNVKNRDVTLTGSPLAGCKLN